MSRLLVALLALGSLSAVAKPLYITVPRSYGTQEAPTVDLAFSGRGPVELRVLRPRDVAAFIRSQSNLRRAYDAPPTTHNPGRALARGLNAVREPGTYLLYAMDPKLRKELSASLPKAQPDLGPATAALQEGAPKLVGVPADLQLVRSQWLNLDLGGADRDFNVPGFEAWGSDSSFQERRVLLDPLPAGVYVLQLVQGRVEGQVMLVVTDLTVQAKQTDGTLLVRVAGLDQRPKAGAAVQVFLPTGAGPSGKTNEAGEVLLQVNEPKLLATAMVGSDVAVVDTDFYSTLAVAPDVFLYTDRPIYHPGDAVRFRGLARKPESFLARLFTPSRREVSVKLLTDGSATVATKAKVDDFGSFGGTFKVPEGLDTGVLRVVAELDGQPHQAEARVQDYVKPTFYLELTPEGETVTPGQPLKVKVKARRYAGGVPPDTKYEVFLYRSLLDSPAWVDDAGKGGAGSAVTYGSASTTEGKLSIPERLHSSVAKRSEEGQVGEDPWESAPTFNERGEAEVEVEVPPLAPGEERLPYRYTLTVRARDDQKTFANVSTAFFLSNTEVLGAPRFSAKVVKLGGEALFALRSTSLGGRPMLQMEGTVTFVLRQADGQETKLSEVAVKTGEDAMFRTAAPTARIGTVLARATLKDRKGQPWSGETSLLVVGEGSEPVARVPSMTLEALDGVLEPGGSAQVVALLPERWGPGGRNAGPMWLTLSGSGLFSTSLVEVSGTTVIQSFGVERRFGSAVYASLAYPTANGRWEERTVPFRIVPAERALSLVVTPLKSEMAPLTEQTLELRVTDHAGEGVVAQVSLGVVDKAVYAVQSELRPKVLDFFYPVARNNVTSFYSNEFQGYGYGEQLARTLGRLPHVRFTSVKPPTREEKREEKDTAYWNAEVVTDAQGHAKVSFKLPANQTLWTVTAVAADASGRFGEATAEFASRGKLNLVASLPQFLREGDTATGSVRLSRVSGKGETGFDVKVNPGDGLGGKQTDGRADLTATGERVVPFALSAARVGVAEVAIAVTGGGEPLRDRRRVPVQPAALQETLQVSTYSGGDLKLPVMATSRTQRVELLLQASTVDAALANVRELLTYPYGCLEQLVSTTAPNVALYQTLQKASALGSLDPDTQALLVEARSRAVQGTGRILALAVKGGGFTWFGGYSEPSVPLTLIALDGLGYAVDAGLVPRNEGALTESAAWLEAQANLPPELEATRAYVLAKLQGSKQAARVRALLERAAASGSDLHSIALAVLAAEKAGIEKEPAVQAQLAGLVSKSREQFFTLASFTPTDAFWRYPLRRVGLTALLGHAASMGELDVAKARRRVLDLLTEPEVSTFDRSTALLHSLWLIERDAKALRRLPPPQVEGVQNVSFKPRGAGLVAVLPPGTQSLRVGSFDGVATLRAEVLTPALDAKPLEQGMSVQRRYFLLTPEGRKPLENTEAVPQGAELFVELTLNARGEERLRSGYYVVEDAIPAGFTPLQEDKEYRGAPHSLPLAHEALKRRSFSPEHVHLFFEEPTWWSDSPRTVGYVVRAQFPGRFIAPPATIQDMYALGRKGRSEPQVLNVFEPPAAAGK